jgi:phosphoglycolate phosphatase
MILQAMDEVGAAPETTLMVGDTVFDIEMAVNAGVPGLGVSWGYHPSEHLDEAGAHMIAEDFSALLGAINARPRNGGGGT